MAEEHVDIFGDLLDPVEDDQMDTSDTVDDEETAEPEESDDDAGEDALVASGDEPTDPAAIRKYWQGAYTKSRQADRERYGQVEQEHKQLLEVYNRFQQDDNYALQLLRQRFPNLANQMPGQSGQSTQGSQQSQQTGITEQLKQKLGPEWGSFAETIGGIVDAEVSRRVNEAVQPLSQQFNNQSQSERSRQEASLLSAMDGKYPGWEESVGATMRDLDQFLGSDALEHPKFGNKYELYYKLLNQDAARSEAIKAMGNAARQRTGLGRTGRNTAPNSDDLVRKAENNNDAFQQAMKAALEEIR